MRKTIKLLLPLLLLCTLLITMTALPTFAAEERFESVTDDASETIIDNATDTAVRIEYGYDDTGYYMQLAGITVYNASMLVDLPFAAELTLAIVAGVIAAWTLIYILWAVKVFPNGTGFDKVMEPCAKYFYRPFTASILATCNKLVKNENKLESFFYWAVLGLGTVHIFSRLTLNLLFGSFSFGAQLLIPLFALLLVFLVIGNSSILTFRFGNLLPSLCSAGILTYLGFQIYNSFIIDYELTLMIWIARVALMALALFFLGLLLNQWIPEIIGATIMQAGGALFLVFAGARFLVHLYTVPGTFFSDLFVISLVPLFYFVYRNLHFTPNPTPLSTLEGAEENTDDSDVTESAAAAESTAAVEGIPADLLPPEFLIVENVPTENTPTEA